TVPRSSTAAHARRGSARWSERTTSSRRTSARGAPGRSPAAAAASSTAAGGSVCAPSTCTNHTNWASQYKTPTKTAPPSTRPGRRPLQIPQRQAFPDSAVDQRLQAAAVRSDYNIAPNMPPQAADQQGAAPSAPQLDVDDAAVHHQFPGKDAADAQTGAGDDQLAPGGADAHRPGVVLKKSQMVFDQNLDVPGEGRFRDAQQNSRRQIQGMHKPFGLARAVALPRAALPLQSTCRRRGVRRGRAGKRDRRC